MNLQTLNHRIAARYAEQIARGEHDDACEYDVRGFYLCHCSKRKREAAGFTEPPSDDLYFPPPSCPHCDGDLDSDGDSWCCYSCRLQWTQHGTDAEFTDDHGDDLAEDSAAWKARAAQLSKGADQ